jgi:hypothetical protein
MYDSNFLPSKKFFLELNSRTSGAETAGANTALADFLHQAPAVLKYILNTKCV